MLSDEDYQEAVRRYKNMGVNGHERQRYHALILVHQGYSYREGGRILLVDEDTIRRWVEQYRERGLGGLRNHPHWGGDHGQRELRAEQVTELQRLLREEAAILGRGETDEDTIENAYQQA
jgi:transposase